MFTIMTTDVELFTGLPGAPDEVNVREDYDGAVRTCRAELTWLTDGRRRSSAYSPVGGIVDVDWPDGTQRSFIVVGVTSGDRLVVELIQTGAPRHAHRAD